MKGNGRISPKGPRWNGYYSGKIADTYIMYIRFDNDGSHDCIYLTQNTATTSKDEIIKNGLNINELRWNRPCRFKLDDNLITLRKANPGWNDVEFYCLLSEDGNTMKMTVEGARPGDIRELRFYEIGIKYGKEIDFYTHWEEE